MCGRFAMMIRPAEMPVLFAVEEEPGAFPPRFNIAPTQPVLTVLEEHGHRVSKLMRWGFVPGWVKDPRDFPLLINARIETMAEKPAFRDALKYGRCIVPASGYYEWQMQPDRSKQPCFVTRADGRPMALAALCSTWAGPNGEEVDTVATITQASAHELADLHDRQPVVLEPDAFDTWLDIRGVGVGEALALLETPPPGTFRFHPVSTRVNSAEFDDGDLIAPITPARPPPRPEQLDLF